MPDWYDTPLYYDIIFDEDSLKEAQFLEAIHWQHGGKPNTDSLRILEPACGSGRLVSTLAQRGHRVHGFDLNPNMLDFARDRLKTQKLPATLWRDRLEIFALPPNTPPFDLAHCLVSTFKYILEEEGAVSHLQRVADVLRPGGLYVLGFHLTDYANQKAQHERWVAERDGIHVICNTHTWPADKANRIEKLRTRLRITQSGESRTQETHWHFRTYNIRQVKQLLDAVPHFELITCHDFNYDPNHSFPLNEAVYDLILILRKRSS